MRESRRAHVDLTEHVPTTAVKEEEEEEEEEDA